MPTIISVGSGKGGVGKSVVVSNLGHLLAKAGQRVVLADLDLGGADLHVMLGIFTPKATLTDFLSHKVEKLEEVIQPVETSAGLGLIPGTGETLATANPPYPTKKRLINHLRKLDVDIVIVDIGAGTNFHALDFYHMADRQIAVGAPDPPSVLDLYRFIKLAAIRKVLLRFVEHKAIQRSLTRRDFTSVEQVLEAVRTAADDGAEIAAETLAEFRPMLIVNRMVPEVKFSALYLRDILRKFVGSDLQDLGAIPEDEMVSRSVRSYLPVVDKAPLSPAATAFRKISSTLLDSL